MNFISNPLKLYIHMIFIIIYVQMKCFRNFPTFWLQFKLLASCKENFINHLSLFWCAVYKPRNVHFKKVKNLLN